MNIYPCHVCGRLQAISSEVSLSYTEHASNSHTQLCGLHVPSIDILVPVTAGSIQFNDSLVD